MRVIQTRITGAYIVEMERNTEWTPNALTRALRSAGLPLDARQRSAAFSYEKGSLCGLHMHFSSSNQARMVHVTQGTIYEVVVDMRPGSPTYLEHVGVELSTQNNRALYFAGTFAFGYQTLTEDSEVRTLSGAVAANTNRRGLRYNDPALGIRWPEPVSVISSIDANWTLFNHR